MLFPFAGTVLEVVSSPVGFFRGRPLFGVDLGGAFSTSEWGISGTASIDGLGFFDGSRENWNPSASSSYATRDELAYSFNTAQQLPTPAHYSPAGRFPSLFVLCSRSCLLALSRVVLCSLAFTVPLYAVAERDCVFGPAIEIVPSGWRRFVLVVVVARTATVMSGGVHAGLLCSGINLGVAKQTPPFRCRLVAS